MMNKTRLIYVSEITEWSAVVSFNISILGPTKTYWEKLQNKTADVQDSELNILLFCQPT